MASETIAPSMPPPAPPAGPGLPPPNVALPPRVGIALLTLQLRASLQEEAVAEAEHSRVDLDSSLAELRARLEPLMAERRRQLDEALEDARDEAAASVAAAHREASAIVADASTQSDPAVAEVVTFVPTVLPTAAVEVSNQRFPALPPINVVIDAEAFARVFATILATVLEERAAAWPAALPTERVLPAKSTEPVRVKRSSWTDAMHLDIFLSGLAMVIVLVILFSWLA